MKHTPGPWIIEWGCNEDGSVVYEIQNTDSYTTDIRYANARLIAAAPDSITLAEQVIGFCMALREDKACWADHQDAGVLFAKATTFLAKATGETP